MKALRRALVPAVLLGVLLIAAAEPAFAQKGPALTPEVLKEIQSSFKMDAQTRALMNAITSNDIKSLEYQEDRIRRRYRTYNQGRSRQNKRP